MITIRKRAPSRLSENRSASRIRDNRSPGRSNIGNDSHHETFQQEQQSGYVDEDRTPYNFTEQVNLIERKERNDLRRRSMGDAPEPQVRNDYNEENKIQASPKNLVEKDEIHVQARLIEEKKKKIDREIEKRIQEEHERKRKLASQTENIRKAVEKQGM